MLREKEDRHQMQVSNLSAAEIKKLLEQKCFIRFSLPSSWWVGSPLADSCKLDEGFVSMGFRYSRRVRANEHPSHFLWIYHIAEKPLAGRH